MDDMTTEEDIARLQALGHFWLLGEEYQAEQMKREKEEVQDG